MIPTSTITAVFGENGTISGDGGVGAYSGAYSEEGVDGITIGETTASWAGGPKELMAQEAAYLKALRSASTFRVSQKALVLRTAEGDVAVQMEPAR